METITYAIRCDEGQPLSSLFSTDEKGHLAFGIAGWSKEPAAGHQLLIEEVEFRGYIMEGFIRFFVSAEETPGGLRLVIRKNGSNRDAHLDWFVERSLDALGCTYEKKCLTTP
ncbi:hypothetical protein [Methylobacter sp. sgz302048]|jgi:hypothetical protein|uniref:hypothetical protein n=1 Tax=Methylobacter sp. sgz302048 TaxID=3455945 RepID=UPI003F9F0159